MDSPSRKSGPGEELMVEKKQWFFTYQPVILYVIRQSPTANALSFSEL